MFSSYCTSLRLKRYVAYLDLALSYTTPEKNSLYRACRKLAGSSTYMHTTGAVRSRAWPHSHTHSHTATHTRGQGGNVHKHSFQPPRQRFAFWLFQQCSF